MTDGETPRSFGWPALRDTAGPPTDPFTDWYETWRAQHSARRQAEEAERVRMRREIRWLSALIALWSLVMGAAAALAIWLIL